MNQTAVMAVAAMLDQFNARSNPDLTLASYEEVLRGVPDPVIAETARRFKAGEVEGQSLDFAPTSARFAAEARRLAELRSWTSRPRLPAPDFHRSTIPPFIANREKAREKFVNWDVLEKDVPLERFKLLSQLKQLPVGATWVAALATIFVPRKA